MRILPEIKEELITNFVWHKDRKIAYMDLGGGIPVILLHGFCEDRTMWDEYVLMLSAFHRVITIDIGGFGDSDLPIEATIAAMTEQVYAVFEVLNLSHVVLAGHSMGGYVAIDFASKHADRLRGLALLHTHPFGDTAEQKLKRDKSIEFVKKHGSNKYISSLLPVLFTPAFRIENEKLIKKMVAAVRRTAKRTLINALKAMKDRPNQAAVLEKLDIPVFFLLGKLDVTMSWENNLHQVTLPELAEVHILEDIGHMGILEVANPTFGVFNEFINLCFKRYDRRTINITGRIYYDYLKESEEEWGADN